jgi:hypothetical protein
MFLTVYEMRQRGGKSTPASLYQHTSANLYELCNHFQESKGSGGFVEFSEFSEFSEYVM